MHTKTSNFKTNKLQNLARNLAAADVFKTMNSEEDSAALHAKLSNLPDDALDKMAAISEVPTQHFHIYRAMVRGQPNEFNTELEEISEMLQTGDVVLMTGLGSASQLLVNAQKFSYPNYAKSSHVAMIHAEFVCIDAMPKFGVSSRIISEVLSDVEEDWRVIRFAGLGKNNQEALLSACVFYLYQPYYFRPSRKHLRKAAYCSELVRKVYSDAGVENTGISSAPIVMPANFDQLAESHPKWEDVTEKVRPAVNFCRKYPALVRVVTKLMIDGLKLNYERYKERERLLKTLPLLARKGQISSQEAKEIRQRVKDMESRMAHQFWSTTRDL